MSKTNKLIKKFYKTIKIDKLIQQDNFLNEFNNALVQYVNANTLFELTEENVNKALKIMHKTGNFNLSKDFSIKNMNLIIMKDLLKSDIDMFKNIGYTKNIKSVIKELNSRYDMNFDVSKIGINEYDFKQKLNKLPFPITEILTNVRHSDTKMRKIDLYKYLLSKSDEILFNEDYKDLKVIDRYHNTDFITEKTFDDRHLKAFVMFEKYLEVFRINGKDDVKYIYLNIDFNFDDISYE